MTARKGKPRMKLRVYVELTVKFAQEDGKWTAECVELGTAAYGDTFEKAQEAIADMILLHLNALEDMKCTAEFFRKHKILFHRAQSKPKSLKVPMRSGELVERVTAPVQLAEAV
jgi:predicted RNase H-like HicB family nuclease